MSKFISDERSRLQIIKKLFFQTNNQSQFLDPQFEIIESGMDDAALIKVSQDDSIVIASDFVRGSEFYLFKLGYLNYFDIGYYLIAANLSDIAAMGARPFALSTVVRYSQNMTDEEFTQILRGIKAAADFFDVRVVGGDIGGHSADVLTATALGFIKTENVLLRKNVQDGDLLCVTGTIGLPITALVYFKKAKQLGFSLSFQEEEKILYSWKRPSAKIVEASILSEEKLASACQDISDGLKATIQQLSSASNKNFTIYANKLPIDEITKKLASFFDIDCVQIAVSASVDFELLFTISPEKQLLCSTLFRERGCKYTVIGEVNSLGRNILLDRNDDETEVPGVSWHQQTGDYLEEIIS